MKLRPLNKFQTCLAGRQVQGRNSENGAGVRSEVRLGGRGARTQQMDFCGGLRMQSTRGAALLACLFGLLLLTFLGALALSSAGTEMKMAFYQERETAALYLAEAGIHLMVYWFGHPEAAPLSTRDFLKPRFTRPNGTASFFNEAGVSQFSGNRLSLDLQVCILCDQESRDFSWSEVWDALDRTGEIVSLKIYAPSVPGAIGTLESTARTDTGVQKTLVVQLVQRDNTLRVLPLKGTWHEID